MARQVEQIVQGFWEGIARSHFLLGSPLTISECDLRFGGFFVFALFALLGSGSGFLRSLVGFDFGYCLGLPLRIGISEDELSIASPYTCFGHFFADLFIVDLNAVLDHVDHILGLSCAGHAMDAPGTAYVCDSLACIVVAARDIRNRILGEELQHLLGAGLNANTASGAGLRIDHGHIVLHVNSVKRARHFTVAVTDTGEVALVRAAERYGRGLASVKTNVRMLLLDIAVVSGAPEE